MGVDDAGDRDPAARELLDDHRVGGQVEAHPAVVLGDRDPEQAELLHLLDDRLGELVLVVELLGDGDDLVVDELAHHLGDRLLIVRLLLIRRGRYGHGSFGVVFRASRAAGLGPRGVVKDTGGPTWSPAPRTTRSSPSTARRRPDSRPEAGSDAGDARLGASILEQVEPERLDRADRAARAHPPANARDAPQARILPVNA